MQETINQPETHFIKQGRFVFAECHLLGKGTTGTVYKGHDNQQNTPVAIKAIHTATMNQVEKNLIQNQKKALKSLKHPNIMKLIHIEQQPSYTFIVSQLYEGGSLQEYLNKRGKCLVIYQGCLSEFQAMEFFSKIVGGYCAIVDANIIHRDLKPMNILLTKNNDPVIIDFGYSQIIVANRNLTVFNVGSPSYMSPQAFTKTIYSERSDVWSLGAIFYQLLTNKTLDHQYQTKQYFQLLKNSQYPPIDFDLFSDVVKEILKASLAVKLEQRATANRIKYLLDKEILGKKFQGKIAPKADEIRQSITNSKSVANFVSFVNNNNIVLSKQSKDQEVTKMSKQRPALNKTYSSIPLQPKKYIAHSSQNIQQTTFMRQGEDCIIERESQADTNSYSNSINCSLSITPTVSRVQYRSAHQYQRSFGPAIQSKSNFFFQQAQRIQIPSVQNSINNEMIQLNNFNHPKFSRQASFNSNSSDSDFLNYQSQHGKSFTYNNGNNQMMPSKFSNVQNNNKLRQQQLFFSNQINQPQKNQINQQSKLNIPFAKQFSTTSEKFGNIIQKVGYNDNFMTNGQIKYSKPINIKQLSQKLQENAAVQFINQVTGIQSYGLKQPQQINQAQKLYQSQQNISYQKMNFQQSLRTSINPKAPYQSTTYPMNSNNNQIFNLNLPFGQSIRGTVNPKTSRTVIGLKQNA